jgi:hypothetical protein
MSQLNNNFYNELQDIASAAIPKAESNTNPVNVEDGLSKQATAKLKESTDLAMQMYPSEAGERFDFWKKQNKPENMDPATKDIYWKTYEQMHPEGKVGATRDFVDITKVELDTIGSNVGKEYFLRDRLVNTPVWARKELDPMLGILSANVANSNYSKSQQVYMKDLELRSMNFAAKNTLDPDVSIDSHTQDAVKLEQLNLLELGTVQEGRIGVYSEGGQFIPAFGLTDRKEIFAKDMYASPSLEEQSVVRGIAPNIIRKAVEGNLAVNRNKIQSQERTGEAVASNYLTTGAFGIDKWNTAFAMLPNVSNFDKIKQGLQGEIASGRITSEKDLIRTIYQSMVNFGHLFDTTKETK